MSLPATEDFAGAAGALSGSWTQQNAATPIARDGAGLGTVTVVDAATGATAYWNSDHFTPNQYSQATFLGGGSFAAYCGVAVRRTGIGGTTCGYALFVDGATGTPNHTSITRADNGATTVLLDISQAWSSGDVMRLEIVGTTLTVKRNGAAIGNVSDATYTIGAAGLRAANVSAAPTFDTWEGGNLQPDITAQSNDQTVNEGQDATYTVTATSSGGTLHYQWKFNGSNVGSDSNSYTRTGCVLADSGGTVTCTVTDDNGSSTTPTVYLTVLQVGKPWHYVA